MDSDDKKTVLVAFWLGLYAVSALWIISWAVDYSQQLTQYCQVTTK